MGYHLGVDIGTTSVAAALATDSRVEMFALGDRTIVSPAMVYRREDDILVFGDAAARRATSSPDRIGRELKRRLGDPTSIMLGGVPYAVTTLLGALLDDVLTRVTETEGTRPDSVVLTHPAGWGPYRRELFDEVPRLAGLTSRRMVTEPEAAAAHYAASRQLSDGEIIAVYDLGGGTFDATVLRKHPGGMEILGVPEGIEHLGGVDFDASILSHVDHASGGAVSELDLNDPRTATALARLEQDCALAKETLSVDVETTVTVILPDRHVEIRLTRAEFEEMIRVPIESTIDALVRTLRSAQVDPKQLSATLLVGGCARIPLVSRMISEELGRRPVVAAHPEHAVALGAATLARTGAGDRPTPRRPSRRASTAAMDENAAPEQVAVEETPEDRIEPSAVLDDDVQFTVYRPAVVRPARWYPLLAFAHRTEPLVDPDTGEVVDPIELVTGQANQLLRDQNARYHPVSGDSRLPLPRGGELLLQPWLAEGDVNPKQATLHWEEPVHRVEFRVRIPEHAGRRVIGGLRVFLGVILIAEVPFTISVASHATGEQAKLERVPGKRYRRIFASYSHKDAPLVTAVISYISATGDRYLIDTLSLRSGERWEPRLAELIEQSDIFQLFWSHNAMSSPQVRREWEHALSLDREGFIRPVYWEDPRPTDLDSGLPPPTLNRLHWAKLPTPGSNVEQPAGAASAPLAPGAFHPPDDPVPRAVPASPPPAPRAGAPGPPGDAAPTPPSAGRGGRGRALLVAAVAGVLLTTGVGSIILEREATQSTVAQPTRATPPEPSATDSPQVIVPEPPAASVPVPSVGPTIAAGATPGFVVVSPDGRRAYLADRTEGIITVVDTAANRVTTTIPVAAGPPQFLSFSPDGRTIYVSIWDDDRTVAAIGVLDTTIDAMVATIPLRTRPYATAVSPDGKRLYVPTPDTGTVTLIDTATVTVTTEITSIRAPRWVEFSTDGRRAYTTGYETNVVSVLDTSDNTARAEIPVDRGPYSIAVHPTRPLLGNVNSESATVTMIDTNTEKVVARIPVGNNPQDIVWAPDGRFAYTANAADNTISVISADTMTVTATVPTGASPTSVAVLPNGTTGYVTNLRDGTLTSLNLAG